MTKDWLWDKKISERQASKILRNTNDPAFISLSAVLLARNNEPAEIFKGYLTPENFCRYWLRIKKKMRKDAWNNPRIEFWQAVYEKLPKRYKNKALKLPSKYAAVENEFCLEVGSKIKDLRKENGLTQEAFSKRINVSQQMVSRIESGQENVSLLTLKRVLDGLGAKLLVVQA